MWLWFFILTFCSSAISLLLTYLYVNANDDCYSDMESSDWYEPIICSYAIPVSTGLIVLTLFLLILLLI
jgi:hypothetical protein